MEPIEYNSINCNELFYRIFVNDSISKDFWEAKRQANKLRELNLIFDRINSYYGDNHYGY